MYGFKSTFNPPASKHLISFKKDMINLITDINYRKCNNSFQNILNNDIKKTKKSDQIIVWADKTNNMYKLSKEEYNTLLLNNISDTYKKSNENIVNEINEEAKEKRKMLNWKTESTFYLQKMLYNFKRP